MQSPRYESIGGGGLHQAPDGLPRHPAWRWLSGAMGTPLRRHLREQSDPPATRAGVVALEVLLRQILAELEGLRAALEARSADGPSRGAQQGRRGGQASRVLR